MIDFLHFADYIVSSLLRHWTTRLPGESKLHEQGQSLQAAQVGVGD